jgi:large subunit ribosomal protein L7/L12
MLSRLGSSTSRALRKRVLTNSSHNSAIAAYHSSSLTPQSESPAPIRRKKHVLSEESKEKVEAIFQKILWLDMVEVHLLTELINQKMGLILTDKERAALRKECDRQIMAEAGAVEVTEQAVEEEQGPKTVDLKLTGYDEKSKIKVIKEVRAIAGLGLKEAKELVEGAPKVITKDLSPEAAAELKEKLEAVGAQVELV